MSSGSSSQVVACFSVDFTKYLMLSKSMPVRSEPQLGMGFLPKSFRPFSRRFSIQAGSPLRPEMSRTTSSFRPRRADTPAASLSDQPYSYVPRPFRPGLSASTLFEVSMLSSSVRSASMLMGGPSIRCGRSCRYPRCLSACGFLHGDGTQRDERGADVLAVGKGRQALDVDPEQARERVRLGVTELGELSCDVLHRAVALA